MKELFITLHVIAVKEEDGSTTRHKKTGLEFEVLVSRIVYIREAAEWEKQNHKAAVKLTTGETLITLGDAADIAVEVQNVYNG